MSSYDQIWCLFQVYLTKYGVSGIVVPKAMSKVMFLTETYEALSFCFFLRLIMTYLGGEMIKIFTEFCILTKWIYQMDLMISTQITLAGKKETSSLLTDKRVKLNSPPLCCLVS
eukprot:sb/3476883/